MYQELEVKIYLGKHTEKSLKCQLHKICIKDQIYHLIKDINLCFRVNIWTLKMLK
jgi:hypothetical protein